MTGLLSLDPEVVAFARRLAARAAEQGRADDTETTVRRRLQIFEERTRPLVDYYERRGILVSIDGMQPVDAVTAQILEALTPVAAAGTGGPSGG